MKKLTALLLALAFAACLLTGCGGAPEASPRDGISGSGSEAAEPEAEPVPPIQLPDQEIETIQINSYKIEDFSGGKSLDDFAEDLSAAEPISARAVQIGELGAIVTLTYADGTKECFDFIQSEVDDSVWYVETEDGRLYQNAEFITEYVPGISSSVWQQMTGSGIPPVMNVQITDPDAVRARIQMELELQELEVSCSTTDLRAAFALKARELLALYGDEETAVQLARDELAGEMAQYQYAVEHGYGLTEEELDDRIAEYNAAWMKAPNFEEVESYYAEQGTTFAAIRGTRREADRIKFVLQNLRSGIYEDFCRGNDRIGDRVCENAGEYWNAFLLDVLCPEMEDYSEKMLTPLLDEAEAFYREHFSQSE